MIVSATSNYYELYTLPHPKKHWNWLAGCCTCIVMSMRSMSTWWAPENINWFIWGPGVWTRSCMSQHKINLPSTPTKSWDLVHSGPKHAVGSRLLSSPQSQRTCFSLFLSDGSDSAFPPVGEFSISASPQAHPTPKGHQNHVDCVETGQLHRLK